MKEPHSRLGVEPDALPGGVTHLLAADDALEEQFQCGFYAAVCGQLVAVSDLPSSECPEGCECDLALYCPQCVSQAAESSDRAPVNDPRPTYDLSNHA